MQISHYSGLCILSALFHICASCTVVNRRWNHSVTLIFGYWTSMVVTYECITAGGPSLTRVPTFHSSVLSWCCSTALNHPDVCYVLLKALLPVCMIWYSLRWESSGNITPSWVLYLSLDSHQELYAFISTKWQCFKCFVVFCT